MSKKSVIDATTISVIGEGMDLQYSMGGYINPDCSTPMMPMALVVGYNVIPIPDGTKTIVCLPDRTSTVKKVVIDSGGPGIEFAPNRPIMWGVPDGYKNYFYIYSSGVELITICFL